MLVHFSCAAPLAAVGFPSQPGPRPGAIHVTLFSLHQNLTSKPCGAPLRPGAARGVCLMGGAQLGARPCHAKNGAQFCTRPCHAKNGAQFLGPRYFSKTNRLPRAPKKRDRARRTIVGLNLRDRAWRPIVHVFSPGGCPADLRLAPQGFDVRF